MFATRNIFKVLKLNVLNVSNRKIILSHTPVSWYNISNISNRNYSAVRSLDLAKCTAHRLYFKHPTHKWHNVQITRNCTRNTSKSGDESENEDDRLRIFMSPLTFLKSGLNMLMLKRIDTKYNDAQFFEGVKQSFTFVTKSIEEGNVEDLHDLVTDNVMTKLKLGYGLCSPNAHIFGIKESDIIQMYVVDVTMGQDDTGITDSKPLRVVKVLVVFCFMKDWKEYEKKTSIGLREFLKIMAESGSAGFSNYQFVRRYSQFGPVDQWTINHIKHFTLDDYVKS